MQQTNISDQLGSSRKIIKLLAEHRLLPSLVRELVIDEAIAPFTCDELEMHTRVQMLLSQEQVLTDDQQQAWIAAQGFRDQSHFLQWVERQIKLDKFKLKTWGLRLRTYFLQRKDALDQVIYSFIRVRDEGLALELYCRLAEGEESLQDLAKEYSEGFERSTGGMIGPCPLTKPHPDVRRKLISSAPGEICYPMHVGEWWVILRLEQLLPSQLDATTRQHLLNELFENWMQQQVDTYIVNLASKRMILI
ncbi:peptidylprolyl isomerase [Oscillatoria sp. FACHB-1407]|uniref:peptidylprolyl isomerase n=1 Tax=Oscillatoria sp. FACHB-1407 TaxID=2692847 RepID=UPI001684CBD9|nr:peptidylprolyl isomerase [Oscillatoria sp. FACHB-1407]MBD2462567.1 peptidylprolyl isomerase [Oscillatoria sp. FACHB-1407]